MIAQPATSLLEQFDLLPPSFRYRHRLRGILCGWVTLVCFLLAVLIGVTAITVMRTVHTNRTNQQIASTAIPLLDLRRDVFRLQEENQRRQRLCRWIQSAKPQDSMLQMLAAIAAASQTGERPQTGDAQITIDTVALRLPVEFPGPATKPPAWAEPFLTIVARPTSIDLVQSWVDRLNSLDRVTEASVAAESVEVGSKNGDISSVRLTATPVSGRVQP